MRIVHTESSLGWGGQEIRILRESQKLASMGHEVTVLCDEASIIAKRAQEWAPSVECRQTKLKKKRLRYLLHLRSALANLAPDVVVCHSSTDHWLTAVARLISKRKFPIVRARHISAQVRGNITSKWLFRRGCESVITTGSGIKEALTRSKLCAPNRVFSIPTGLDAAKYQGLSRGQAREMLGLDQQLRLIGIIATLRSWKGHTDLIHAFKLLDDPSAGLLIVGDGPRRAALHALSSSLGLSSTITFVGQQSNVAPWFAALDVYAQPSYANEGVPQAILQAMATGLPIVSCPIGGIPEAVANYRAAKLVPVHSPEELAEAIKTAIAELAFHPDRSDLSHTPFTEQDMALKCEQIYRRTIGEFRRS